MRLRLVFIVTMLVVPSLAWSQPLLFSVTNSASYSEEALAQGSIFTVFGYGIGPAELQKASSYPLPFQVAGVSIQVTAGGSVFNCPMLYASSGQASAILPSNAPVGPAKVNLTYSGRADPFGVPITIRSSAFGIYSIDSSGVGPGVITGADFKVKGFHESAAPGETVILWGTGLGPIDGGDSDVPSTNKQFSNVTVFIGNSPAKILYAGRSGCCAGLDQIALQLPASPSGCFVPVTVRGSDLTSNFVTLAVHTAGGACSDPAPGLPGPILAKAVNGEELRLGAAAIGPMRVLAGAGFQFARSISQQLSEILHKPVSEDDVKKLADAYRTSDWKGMQQILRKYEIGKMNRALVRALRSAIGMDQQGAAAAFGLSRGLSPLILQFAWHLIPVGTCIVNREKLMPSIWRTRALDAGEVLNFSGPMGQRSLTRVRGQYQLSLGSGFQTANVPPGVYRISGNGGVDIPAFSATLNVAGSITLTNKADLGAIHRSEPLTVTWSGSGAAAHVLIGGSVHSDGVNTTLVCVEESVKASLTIPAFVLSGLPAAPSKDAYLFIAAHPFSNPVNIPGLDLAYFVDGSSDYLPVELR